MVVIPAIDILGGKCVRLTHGDYEQATVYSDDPMEVAERFATVGARRVHVVDLDAARGTGENRKLIGEILRRHELQLQVAGGVRDLARVDAVLAAGAEWVVMGTTAVNDRQMFERCVARHPGKILAALDVRDDKAAVSGWTESSQVMIGALIGRWDPLPLAGIILTCIDRDGTMSGPDLETLAKVRKMTGRDLHYSGGIASLDDVSKVAERGAQAVILGRAIYEGRIDLGQALAV